MEERPLPVDSAWRGLNVNLVNKIVRGSKVGLRVNRH